MSGHFLLAPIPESSSDYLLPKDIKLAVLGAGRVGKSAMIVRFLTKRFIGDYEPNTGKLYSRLVYVEGDQVSLQIQDTPGGNQVQDNFMQVGDPLSKCVQWAEGFLLVYSITDYDSYLAIRPLHQHIRKVHPDSRAPVVIVGNKGDLLHARQVQTREGVQLANELGSLFLEVSTSENYEDVCDAFRHLCREVSKLHNLGAERRRAPVVPRPRSPNMQDLKRRFKQALSSKTKAPSAPALGHLEEIPPQQHRRDPKIPRALLTKQQPSKNSGAPLAHTLLLASNKSKSTPPASPPSCNESSSDQREAGFETIR
ncbi:hypothetical protein Celaphus_00016633 [Cervus elaphus hippelaphus]|uniref:small monomeric GTPase n=1 Tax=Cervus elaphus hippelaphus TaxID=46360 RepID=A0A212C3Q4_CEREH|nr:hypothetical protein Celaphus_00016633 [Cervus elaphus hippelaphus]